MANTPNGSTPRWQDRVHQLEFTQDQIDKLKAADQRTDVSLHDVLVGLAVDNNSIRVKSVEFHGSYTFSYTLDKNHPQFPGHTWWFYDIDVGRGLRAMSMFVEMFLPDWTDPTNVKEQSGLW